MKSDKQIWKIDRHLVQHVSERNERLKQVKYLSEVEVALEKVIDLMANTKYGLGCGFLYIRAGCWIDCACDLAQGSDSINRINRAILTDKVVYAIYAFSVIHRPYMDNRFVLPDEFWNAANMTLSDVTFEIPPSFNIKNASFNINLHDIADGSVAQEVYIK